MIQVMVVDDEPLALEALTKLITADHDFRVVARASSGKEALEKLKTEAINVVFLDIEMPEVSGLELIKNIDPKPCFIVVSGRSEYAVAAFEYNVVDYLLKPVAWLRFHQAVERARSVCPRKHPSAKQLPAAGALFIKADTNLYKRLEPASILWIEAMADYVALYTDPAGKTQSQPVKHVLHSTMKNIENKLPADDFIRVHRSYIVRIDRIASIEENTMSIGNKLIPVGRLYRSALMQRLNLL